MGFGLDESQKKNQHTVIFFSCSKTDLCSQKGIKSPVLLKKLLRFPAVKSSSLTQSLSQEYMIMQMQPTMCVLQVFYHKTGNRLFFFHLWYFCHLDPFLMLNFRGFLFKIAWKCLSLFEWTSLNPSPAGKVTHCTFRGLLIRHCSITHAQ